MRTANHQRFAKKVCVYLVFAVLHTTQDADIRWIRVRQQSRGLSPPGTNHKSRRKNAVQ
jgi:hypothetical protein